MKSKIKLVIVADYPIGGKQIDGGVQAVSYYIVSGLRRVPEIDLTILTFRTDVDAPQLVKDGDIDVHILPRARRANNVTFYRRDLTTIRNCLAQIKPDLVHAQDASVEGYLVAKSGYPSVVTFHGMISEDAKYMSRLIDKLRFMFIAWVAERYCVKYPGNKILISPYVQRHYGDRLKGRSEHIPNPIKREFFEVESISQPGRILYAGKIIRRKGIVDLVKALGEVDPSLEFKLVLAGAQDDQIYIDEINKTISECKLEGRVEYLGLLNEAQVLEEFAKASILALPSYQETAPMVVQQAMATHTAVLATEICGVPDQLDSGNCGLMFKPGDYKTCARHLTKLLTEPDFTKQLTDKAFVKASEHYHVDKVVEKTVNFYKQILG